MVSLFASQTCSILVPKSLALKFCHCLLLFNIAPTLANIAKPLHWHHNIAPTLAQYCNVGQSGPNMPILGQYCANIVCQQGSNFRLRNDLYCVGFRPEKRRRFSGRKPAPSRKQTWRTKSMTMLLLQQCSSL